jgi:hypothetical protein
METGESGGGSAPTMRWRHDASIVVVAVLPRPHLWWEALRTLTRLSRRGWWRRSPYLPLPGDGYWQFRMVTAFGGSGESAELTSSDVVAYLEWCRRAQPRRG